MKKVFFLLIALVTMTLGAKAQDIITLKDGSQIQAKVMEINPTDIKYKDFNNQDGPVITIQKDGVSMIQYANGTRTVFNDPYNKNQTPSGGYKREANDRGNNRGHDRYSSSGNGYRKKTRDTRVHGWYFGANADLGWSNATSTDPNYTTSAAGYSGLTICATKMFNQHLGVQFGLGFESYSYNLNLVDGNTTVYGYTSDQFSLNCLKLPARLVYFSNSKKPVGMYAMAGFDLSLLTTARDQEGDDMSSIYNNVYLSPSISAGVDIRTRNANSVWLFGPFYKTTVANIYSSSTALTGYVNNGTINGFGLSIIFMHKYFRGI